MTDYKTTAPPPEQHLTPDQLYIKSYSMGVTIPLAQNMLGGLGAFLIVFIVAWRAGMEPKDSLTLAAVIGGLLFGVACVVRAFRDEVRFVLGAFGERQDKQTRAALEAEVRQLRDEMKVLRSQGVINAKHEALAAAERLLGDYFERHLDMTRSAAMQRGYSRALWDAAQKVLRAASVVDGHGVVKPATYAEAWAAVLRSQSSGMGTFAVTEHGDMVRTK
jgi:hypothetical protein